MFFENNGDCFCFCEKQTISGSGYMCMLELFFIGDGF